MVVFTGKLNKKIDKDIMDSENKDHFEDDSIKEIKNKKIDDESEIDLDKSTDNAEMDKIVKPEEKMLKELEKTKEYLEQQENRIDEKKKILDSMFDELNQKRSLWQWVKYDINIESDIPPEMKSPVLKSRLLFIMTVFALFMNCIGNVLVATMSKNVVIAPMNNVLASIIMFAVMTFAEIFFFKSLYYALRISKSKNVIALMTVYWILFSVHCGYILYSMIGFPTWATLGVLNIVTQLGPGGSWTVIILGFVNVALWTAVACVTLIVFRLVKRIKTADMKSLATNEINTGLFNSIQLDV